jgi:hypothetical protein
MSLITGEVSKQDLLASLREILTGCNDRRCDICTGVRMAIYRIEKLYEN